MKDVISIKVYDAEWLALSAEDIAYLKEIKEPEDIDLMKYQEGVSFKFDFSIEQYTVHKNTNYVFELVKRKADEIVRIGEITMDDITIVDFVGANKTGQLILSSDILHGDFQASKSGQTRYYYFYIDGRVSHSMIAENIWLSEKCINEIQDKYPDANLKRMDNIIPLSYIGRNPISK